ncbi:peptidyl-tRNA hydrolase, PTH1 family [Cnuella takakiae]|uniref:Peptidyl-tRNA hydrolase n=1 Tax=Cnuella takakiae TaxID=1302690 RepID=A0A1M5C039_9BACT|nr:aminoacyl-tRNA hydrolase [Cnuella takakiae]OLY93575.1 aminoacyl-tRNA hydrolase [Cnuella takakiae]SHF48099.1 peptidyl-tRNA hydrolase, PTH1 family [Cnuella takakiae]
MKYLIACLGNIGAEYAHTRHNIGFDVAEAFVQKHGGQFRSDRLASVAEIRWKGRIFIVICPTTFMNLSGKAVKYWMDKEKIALENLLVIFDDLAIPLNKLRLRPGGSDGGHNGLKSIQESLGTTNYPKLRFGIGNEFAKGRQVDFVLGKWTAEEQPLVKLKIGKAVETIESLATVGLPATMNRINNVEFAV